MGRGRGRGIQSFFGPDTRSSEQQAADRERQLQNLRAAILDIKRRFPNVRDIPDEWIAETEAHNPGGPSIRLNPPRFPSPTPDDVPVDPSPDDHVIDISRESYRLPKTKKDKEKEKEKEKEKKEKTYPITRETRSDVRNYAALSNAFLLRNRGLKVKDTKQGGLRTAAQKIATTERARAPVVYPKGRSVGHLPDSSVSGVAHSPMGFMPITSDANTLVGYASGIGLKIGKPIPAMVVRERNGRSYRYGLPPAAAAASSSASSSGSATSSSTTSSSTTSSSTTSSSSLLSTSVGSQLSGDGSTPAVPAASPPPPVAAPRLVTPQAAAPSSTTSSSTTSSSSLLSTSVGSQLSGGDSLLSVMNKRPSPPAPDDDGT